MKLRRAQDALGLKRDGLLPRILFNTANCGIELRDVLFHHQGLELRLAVLHADMGHTQGRRIMY